MKGVIDLFSNKLKLEKEVNKNPYTGKRNGACVMKNQKTKCVKCIAAALKQPLSLCAINYTPTHVLEKKLGVLF